MLAERLAQGHSREVIEEEYLDSLEDLRNMLALYDSADDEDDDDDECDEDSDCDCPECMGYF